MSNRVFNMKFADIYKLYVQKITIKGRIVKELDDVICWLTGFSDTELKNIISDKTVTLEAFFGLATKFNPNASLIKGVICGYRVEDILDPLMQKIRYLDKLVDELAKGKPLERIFRG